MYGNSHSRFGKSISRFGKKKPEDEVASTALKQSIGWLDELMKHEFAGRGDKEYLVRHRISENCGVPERYLYRLQYQAREMKDVAGEYYRRLMIYYDSICEKNEAAADSYRTERMGMRGHHEETDKEPASAGVGMDSSEV